MARKNAGAQQLQQRALKLYSKDIAEDAERWA
jgi:hypothetical protein